MNPKVKKKWLEALRSGEYKQAKGALCIPAGAKHPETGGIVRRDSFCCLGVLSNLYIEEEGKGKWKGTKFQASGDWVAHPDMPPNRVLEWANLDFRDAQELSTMNDKGCSFKQIANYIKRKL